MHHIDFDEQEHERDDRDALKLTIAKLPARIRRTFLSIGSVACSRPTDDIVANSTEIGPPTDWLPVALVPASAPKSGKRCFSLFCGSHRTERVLVDVEITVSLLNRGLLCSVPGELTNLTLSTSATELLRSGKVTIRQVRNVKPAWNHEEMDRRWKGSTSDGKDLPTSHSVDVDPVRHGPVMFHELAARAPVHGIPSEREA